MEKAPEVMKAPKTATEAMDAAVLYVLFPNPPCHCLHPHSLPSPLLLLMSVVCYADIGFCRVGNELGPVIACGLTLGMPTKITAKFCSFKATDLDP